MLTMQGVKLWATPVRGASSGFHRGCELSVLFNNSLTSFDLLKMFVRGQEVGSLFYVNFTRFLRAALGRLFLNMIKSLLCEGSELVF